MAGYFKYVRNQEFLILLVYISNTEEINISRVLILSLCRYIEMACLIEIKLAPNSL